MIPNRQILFFNLGQWWLRYGLAIEVVLLKYWEGPPLAPLVRPYGSIIDYIQDLVRLDRLFLKNVSSS